VTLHLGGIVLSTTFKMAANPWYLQLDNSMLGSNLRDGRVSGHVVIRWVLCVNVCVFVVLISACAHA